MLKFFHMYHSFIIRDVRGNATELWNDASQSIDSANSTFRMTKAKAKIRSGWQSAQLVDKVLSITWKVLKIQFWNFAHFLHTLCTLCTTSFTFLWCVVSEIVMLTPKLLVTGSWNFLYMLSNVHTWSVQNFRTIFNTFQVMNKSLSTNWALSQLDLLFG